MFMHYFAMNSGLILRPSSSSQIKVWFCNTSIHQFISWRHRSISTSLALCALKCWDGDLLRVEFLSEWGVGYHLWALSRLLGLLCLVHLSSFIFDSDEGGWDAARGGCNCWIVIEGCRWKGAGCASCRALLFCCVIWTLAAKVRTCWTKSLNWSTVTPAVGEGGSVGGNEGMGSLLLEWVLVFLDIAFLDGIENILFTVLFKISLGSFF